MKALHKKYLLTVSNECYPDKWMNADMPNEPQVSLCRQETREKFYGKWEHEVNATRDSTRFRFADCVKGAENNAITIREKCPIDFLRQTREDNATLVSFFKANYSAYL